MEHPVFRQGKKKGTGIPRKDFLYDNFLLFSGNRGVIQFFLKLGNRLQDIQRRQKRLRLYLHAYKLFHISVILHPFHLLLSKIDHRAHGRLSKTAWTLLPLP